MGRERVDRRVHACAVAQEAADNRRMRTVYGTEQLLKKVSSPVAPCQLPLPCSGTRTRGRARQQRGREERARVVSIWEKVSEQAYLRVRCEPPCCSERRSQQQPIQLHSCHGASKSALSASSRIEAKCSRQRRGARRPQADRHLRLDERKVAIQSPWLCDGLVARTPRLHRTPESAN